MMIQGIRSLLMTLKEEKINDGRWRFETITTSKENVDVSASFVVLRNQWHRNGLLLANIVAFVFDGKYRSLKDKIYALENLKGCTVRFQDCDTSWSAPSSILEGVFFGGSASYDDIDGYAFRIWRRY
ncbi:hypothetical protein Tco_0432515 [Tanacetum coccineum]